jgi:acetyl esterase/lipase
MNLPSLAIGVSIRVVAGSLEMSTPAAGQARSSAEWAARAVSRYNVGSHAKDYNIDPNRIVVSGESSGGHLALTTGMIPESAGFGSKCSGDQIPKVAAIVNFYGITDVADLLDGPNRKSYAVSWLGDAPNREPTFDLPCPRYIDDPR